MKKLVLLFSSCFAFLAAIGQSYDKNEVAQLAAFLNLPSHEQGKTNAQALGVTVGVTAENAKEWIGVLAYSFTNDGGVDYVKWVRIEKSEKPRLGGALKLDQFSQLLYFTVNRMGEEVSLTSCPLLKEVVIRNNYAEDHLQKRKLTITGCPAVNILTLDCVVSEFVFKDCTAVGKVDITGTKMDSIDMSGQTAATMLRFNGNAFRSIKIPDPGNYSFECKYNQLAPVEVNRLFRQITKDEWDLAKPSHFFTDVTPQTIVYRDPKTGRDSIPAGSTVDLSSQTVLHYGLDKEKKSFTGSFKWQYEKIESWGGKSMVEIPGAGNTSKLTLGAEWAGKNIVCTYLNAPFFSGSDIRYLVRVYVPASSGGGGTGGAGVGTAGIKGVEGGTSTTTVFGGGSTETPARTGTTGGGAGVGTAGIKGAEGGTSTTTVFGGGGTETPVGTGTAGAGSGTGAGTTGATASGTGTGSTTPATGKGTTATTPGGLSGLTTGTGPGTTTTTTGTTTGTGTTPATGKGTTTTTPGGLSGLTTGTGPGTTTTAGTGTSASATGTSTASSTTTTTTTTSKPGASENDPAEIEKQNLIYWEAVAIPDKDIFVPEGAVKRMEPHKYNKYDKKWTDEYPNMNREIAIELIRQYNNYPAEIWRDIADNSSVNNNWGDIDHSKPLWKALLQVGVLKSKITGYIFRPAGAEWLKPYIEFKYSYTIPEQYEEYRIKVYTPASEYYYVKLGTVNLDRVTDMLYEEKMGYKFCHVYWDEGIFDTTPYYIPIYGCWLADDQGKPIDNLPGVTTLILAPGEKEWKVSGQKFDGKRAREFGYQGVERKWSAGSAGAIGWHCYTIKPGKSQTVRMDKDDFQQQTNPFRL